MSTPSARSTVSLPSAPSRTISARASNAGWSTAASSVQVSSDLPPRSTYTARSPSTRTTRAPALRPGRCLDSGLASRASPGPRSAPARARAEQRRTGWPGRSRPAPRLAARSGAPCRRRAGHRPPRPGRVRAARRPRRPPGAGPPRRSGRTARPRVPRRNSPAGLDRSPRRRQDPVGGGEPAREALGDHRTPGQDAVAVEQRLGHGMRPAGAVRVAVGQQRPPPGHGRRAGAGRQHRSAARPDVAGVAGAWGGARGARGGSSGRRRSACAGGRGCRW